MGYLRPHRENLCLPAEERRLLNSPKQKNKRNRVARLRLFLAIQAQLVMRACQTDSYTSICFFLQCIQPQADIFCRQPTLYYGYTLVKLF